MGSGRGAGPSWPRRRGIRDQDDPSPIRSSPRVPSLGRALPWDSRVPPPHHVPGPPCGPVMGDSVPQGRSGDGTAWRFVLRRGAWVAWFPGERSLALGTPGLHDESPLGLVNPLLIFHLNFKWNIPRWAVAQYTQHHIKFLPPEIVVVSFWQYFEGNVYPASRLEGDWHRML